MKSAKQTWLWKIQHPSSDRPSFVFGTMHVQDASGFAWWDQAVAAIEQCPVFAAEYPLDASQMVAQADISFLPDGLTLRDLLRPSHFAKLSRVFEKVTGLKMEPFIRLRPLFLTQIFTEYVLSKDFPESLDQALWTHAQKQEKRMIGIETFQEQLDILKAIPLYYQKRALMGIVTNRQQFRRNLQKATQRYLKGDVQGLYQSVKQGTGHMRKLMLYERNQIMADRIAMYSLREPLVAAIGAGHLGGGKGVLRFLKQKGLVVKPV